MCFRLFASLLLLSLSFFSPISHAEPKNITLLIQEIKSYHDSCRYQRDFNDVISHAKSFIAKKVNENRHMKHPKKLAVVLDIDETSLSNYGYMVKRDFHGTSKQFHQETMRADAPAFHATLELYQWLKHHGVAVFFVTGRFQSERLATIHNLHRRGYTHWNGLMLRPDSYHQHSIIPFKSNARKQISQKGYTILASIGDQNSDIAGGYVLKGFKLPNPYYYLP